MARGRKPIQRTREEAKATRRGQIRRNVQAYRDRKRAPQKKSDLRITKTKQYTFIPDSLDRGNQDVQLEESNLSEPIADAEPSESESIAIDLGAQSSVSDPWCPDEPETPDSHLIEIGSRTGRGSPELLPPAISGAIVSRQQFVSNSAQIFLPGNPKQPGLCMDIGPHWAQTVPDLINKCDVLDASVQALCLLQTARAERQRWLFEASRFYYGDALKRLNVALSEPRKPFRREVFSTALVLETYELFNGTIDGQGTGWKYHIQGASSYLSKFSSHDNILNDQLSFHFLETVCVFDAFRSRKAAPFARTHWWGDSLRKFGGDSYGPLLHLTALVPSLMEESDDLLSSPSSAPSLENALNILERGHSLEDRLSSWLDHTATVVPNFAYNEAFPDLMTTPAIGSEQSELSFPNLYVARLYLLYWSSIVALHGVIFSVTKTLQQSFENTGKGTSRSPWALKSDALFHNSEDQATRFALNIRRSVKFCLQPSHGIVGRGLILLPIWLAEVHFEWRIPEEAQYCRQVLKDLGLLPWQFPTRNSSMSREVYLS